MAENGSQILPYEKFVADFCRLNAASRENANFQTSIDLSGFSSRLILKV
jgi:hypothetical protein